MLRFISSRWWSPACALMLGLLGLVFAPTVGRADPPGQQVGGEGSGTPDTIDPTGSGDPDIPSGPIKGTYKPAVRTGQAGMRITRHEGVFATGVAGETSWLLRLQLALEAYRVIVLHR